MSLASPVALLGLALAFCLPATGWYLRWRRPPDPEADWATVRLGLVRSLLLAGALVALVLVAGEPGDLGLRVPSVGTLVDGVLFGFIALGGSMLVVGLVLQRAGGVAADPASLVVLDQPVHRQLGVAVLTAGTEAVVFYGFVVEAVAGLGAGRLLAGAVAALGVLLVHARWGARNAAQWVPGAVVLAAVAVLTRSAVVAFLVLLVYAVVSTLSSDADDLRDRVEAG